MRDATKYLISGAVAVSLWGRPARAGDSPPLSDDDLAALANAETVEIYDERPDKPFDRDTEVRLTGEQLAARGAVDLGSALALLPDVTVRDAGRGGFNIDIRGARKGAVSVLIDGVLVTDPYYGTFDVSTIPITDIVQIRVSTTPQSPIDGPGGPGGVIEVLTRDAYGEQLVIVRALGDSLPSVGMTGMMRVPLTRHIGLRLSASGLVGARDLQLPGNESLGESRRSATSAGRLEYRKGDRRIVADGFIDDRHYIAPPSDETRSAILLVDRETSLRSSVKYDDRIRSLQLQGEYSAAYLHRRSRRFLDPELTNEVSLENLQAIRTSGMELATMPFAKEWRWAASTSVEHEKALVTSLAKDYVRGNITLLEGAADLQFERGRWRADAAAGVAVPFGVGADPWPEAKLVGKYRPVQGLELTATGGYKGRLPSLRERFDLTIGNPALGPERVLHAELRGVLQRERSKLEVAPFYKRSTGTIRTSTDPADMGVLVNLGKVRFYGVDVTGRVQVHPKVEVGGAYNYIRALGADTDDALDRLPHHRFEVWSQVTAAKRFSALARLRMFGRSIDQGMPVDRYLTVEGNVTAQLTKEYLAVLRVDDLLDEQPATRVGYHTAGRVVSLIIQGAFP